MLRTQGASSHAGGANRIIVELLEQGSVPFGARVGLRLGLRVGQRSVAITATSSVQPM
jgi:hypothetical protein